MIAPNELAATKDKKADDDAESMKQQASATKSLIGVHDKERQNAVFEQQIKLLKISQSKWLGLHYIVCVLLIIRRLYYFNFGVFKSDKSTGLKF